MIRWFQSFQSWHGSKARFRTTQPLTLSAFGHFGHVSMIFIWAALAAPAFAARPHSGHTLTVRNANDGSDANDALALEEWHALTVFDMVAKTHTHKYQKWHKSDLPSIPSLSQHISESTTHNNSLQSLQHVVSGVQMADSNAWRARIC